MAYTRYPRSIVRNLPRPLQGGMRVLGGGGRRKTLAQQFQEAHDRANAANEKRYNQILGGYDDLRDRVMGGLAGQGQTELRDVDRTYQNMLANQQSSLMNRGFGNASLGQTMAQGVNRERLASRGRVNEQVARQLANYDVGISQGKFGVMERRNDIGPDPNMLVQLAQGMGRGGYGGLPRGTPIGAPIGLTGSQIGSMYNQGLQRHMMMMGMGRMMGVGSPLTHNAGNRAAINQQTRQKKYGHNVQWAPEIPKVNSGPSGIPIQTAGVKQPGPFAGGYQMPITNPTPPPSSRVVVPPMPLPNPNPYSTPDQMPRAVAPQAPPPLQRAVDTQLPDVTAPAMSVPRSPLAYGQPATGAVAAPPAQPVRFNQNIPLTPGPRITRGMEYGGTLGEYQRPNQMPLYQAPPAPAVPQRQPYPNADQVRHQNTLAAMDYGPLRSTVPSGPQMPFRSPTGQQLDWGGVPYDPNSTDRTGSDYKKWTPRQAPAAFERSTDYYGGMKELTPQELAEATRGLTTSPPQGRKWFQTQYSRPVKELFINGKWVKFYRKPATPR